MFPKRRDLSSQLGWPSNGVQTAKPVGALVSAAGPRKPVIQRAMRPGASASAGTVRPQIPKQTIHKTTMMAVTGPGTAATNQMKFGATNRRLGPNLASPAMNSKLPQTTSSARLFKSASPPPALSLHAAHCRQSLYAGLCHSQCSVAGVES